MGARSKLSISRSEETCGRDLEGRQREETAEGEEGRELSELSRRGGTVEGEERRVQSKLSSKSELEETGTGWPGCDVLQWDSLD